LKHIHFSKKIQLLLSLLSLYQNYKRLLLKEKTSLIKEYFFYVQLNKKEMKDIALLTWDETWVDTHHTASHQWTPPNPSDAMTEFISE
jgi:hypothetical protein